MLTCAWHVRDARSLAERIAAPLHVAPPDEGDPNPVEGHVFTAGDRLSVGVEAFPGMEPNDLVLWVESRRALVAGDALSDRGNGLEFPVDWANKGVPPRQILAGCARCSSCRSSTCSRRRGHPPTEPPSSARSPDAEPGSPAGSSPNSPRAR
ncbi:MAG TPA: MBL fold metallo-hydrolase [Gaiellaceae bacterium]|nr:MBL fold metallo-hydrolase [Gaiellaceae bacterium]